MDNAKLALLCGMASLTALFGSVQIAAPQPSILTGSDTSMTQYQSFRANVAQDGPHDLILFGSSTAQQGIDTLVLKSRLQDKLGEPIVAFNFGAGGTSAATLPFHIELAYGVDRPPTAVIMLTPQAAKTNDGHRLALAIDSPYGAALYDPVSWRGALRRWLLDHIQLFGVRHRIRAAMVGDTPVKWQNNGYDDSFGYHPPSRHETVDPSKARPYRQFTVPMADGQVDLLVTSVRRLQSYGAEVWLTESPMNPNRYQDVEAVNAHIRGGIERVAEQTGAHALLLPDDLEFPPTKFADENHMNRAGAVLFTEWLAEELELTPR
jgi:hypothetical protein